MILMGAMNNAIPFSLFAWSQTRIPSGLAAIFNATAPLFTVLAAHFFTRDERLTTRKIFGVLCGISGVSLILGPGVFSGQRGSILGQFACLIAAVCYSLAAIYSRRFREIPAMVLAAVQAAIAALMVLPIALFVEHPWTLAMPNLKTWSALLALGLLSTGLAYAIYFRLLAHAGAVNTVLVTFLIPVTALILEDSVFTRRSNCANWEEWLAFLQAWRSSTADLSECYWATSVRPKLKKFMRRTPPRFNYGLSIERSSVKNVTSSANRLSISSRTAALISP